MGTIAGVRERLRDPRTRRMTADSLLALVLLFLLGLPSAAMAMNYGVPSVPAVGVAASIVMPAALAWQRTRPAASAVVVYASALVHLVVGFMILPVDVLVLVSLYSVTVYGPRWARRAGLLGALAGALLLGVAVGVYIPGRFLWSAVVLWFLAVAGMVFATWAVAVSRRSRIERLDALMERARRLEVERDQEVRLATAAERTRIAREMHDVVAHSLSVVIAQADGGRYAARTDPEAAERALRTISDMGRGALADMRRILGVLRTEDATERLPQPDDADLDRLVEQVRATGLAVSVVRTGTDGPLPPGAGLSVYRIVQEALTNVLKHGGPEARVTVALHRSPHFLLVQVDDDGRGAAATSDGRGQGLVGMRERAALFGGTVEAGPRPGGGYRVRAEIPLPSPGGPRPAPTPSTAPGDLS